MESRELREGRMPVAGGASAADGTGGTELLHAAFAHSPVGMGLASVEESGSARFVLVNQALCDLLGYGPDELRGMELEALIDPVDLERDREQVQALLAREIGRIQADRRVVRKDGTSIWVEIDRSLVAQGDGAGRHLVAVSVHEINARRQRMLRLECDRVAGRVLAAAVTPEGALAAIFPALGDVLDCTLGIAWRVDEEDRVLRCDLVWQPDPGSGRALAALSREVVLGPGAGLPARVWETRRAGFTCDMPEEPGCPRASAAASDGIRGAVAFPLLAGPELLGVVELLSARPDVHAELLEALDDIGSQLGSFFARKRTNGSGAALAPAELLLVEDNLFIARLVREMLAGLDPPLELIHVETLAAARERVLSSPPACVLLDLTLPDAGGLEGLIELRKGDPEMPIVILTGHEDESVAVRALREGAQDYLVKRKVDMDALGRAIRYALERKRSERRVVEQVLQDPLTRLPNRLVLLDRLNVALTRGDRSGGQIALLLLDIQRFRVVNDSLGHRIGDRVLMEIARRLSEAIGPEATVVALGADHFAVLCEEIFHPHAAVETAERMLEAVRAPVRLDDEELRLEGTVGIALSYRCGRDPEELIHSADMAKARARELGIPYDIFEEAARTRIRERLEAQNELRTALEGGQLWLAYQPIVHLASGSPIAFEALLRWRHPERGEIAAAEFVPVAEESGLLVPIGAWTLGEACRQLGAWQAASGGPGSLRMNVNLSAVELRQPGLVDQVAAAVKQSGIHPQDLVLEMTESTLIEDLDWMLSRLQELKGLGITLAFDDFGTGYSSLGYLRRLPIDQLKVDRSLVTGLADDPRLPAIIEAIIRMAGALGMQTVAEGIETQDDLDRLRSLGCALGQGYFLGRPAAAESAAERLRARVPSVDVGAA